MALWEQRESLLANRFVAKQRSLTKWGFIIFIPSAPSPLAGGTINGPKKKTQPLIYSLNGNRSCEIEFPSYYGCTSAPPRFRKVGNQTCVCLLFHSLFALSRSNYQTTSIWTICVAPEKKQKKNLGKHRNKHPRTGDDRSDIPVQFESTLPQSLPSWDSFCCTLPLASSLFPVRIRGASGAAFRRGK